MCPNFVPPGPWVSEHPCIVQSIASLIGYPKAKHCVRKVSKLMKVGCPMPREQRSVSFIQKSSGVSLRCNVAAIVG